VEKRPLTLEVLNKVVPLNLDAEEEAVVRAAAADLEVRVRDYKRRFNIKEESFALLLVCLEYATDLHKSTGETADLESYVAERLRRLDYQLSLALPDEV